MDSIAPTQIIELLFRWSQGESVAREQLVPLVYDELRRVDVASRVGRLLLEAEELDFVPCSVVFSEAFETFAGRGGRG